MKALRRSPLPPALNASTSSSTNNNTNNNNSSSNDNENDDLTSSSPLTPAPSPTPSTFYNTRLYQHPDHNQRPSPISSTHSDDGGDGLLVPKCTNTNANTKIMRDKETLLNAKDIFEKLDVSDKQHYIQMLLKDCGREVLSSTQDFISPLLKKDPFQVLPREISFQILSYIDDPTTLARASQVSKLWYLILSDDLTWKELCKTHHFRRLSAAVNTNYQERYNRLPSVAVDPASLTQDDLAEAIYDPEASKKPIPTNYRIHFKHEYMLNNAWNNGGRLAARYVIQNPGVVTALLMTERYIVIALDNSKIFVFREDGKMLRSLFGHVMGVWALTLKGDTLVSGGCDRDVRVWDLKTGNCMQILRGHSSTVRCLQMVDEKTAVSGSRDTTIRVWDLERGVCKKVLHGHSSSVRCLEVVGDICVSGSYDFTARVWRISDGTCLHTLSGHFSQIYSLSFDGEKVVTGSLDASIRVWSALTGECLAILQGHTSLVGQLQMKNNLLVSGGSDGAVRVWDLVNYKCIHRFAAHDNSVTSLQFDENRVVSGGSDGQVRVWDINTGMHIRDLSHKFDSVWRVAFRDEKVAILASQSNRIYMELTSFTPPREAIEEDEMINSGSGSGNNLSKMVEFSAGPKSWRFNNETDDEIAPNEKPTDLTLEHSTSPPVDPNEMDLS